MKENIKQYTYEDQRQFKSHLNSKNVIEFINSRAISIIRYSAGIVEWTMQEVQQLDRKTRKLLTIYNMFLRKGDVDRSFVH